MFNGQGATLPERTAIGRVADFSVLGCGHSGQAPSRCGPCRRKRQSGQPADTGSCPSSGANGHRVRAVRDVLHVQVHVGVIREETLDYVMES